METDLCESIFEFFLFIFRYLNEIFLSVPFVRSSYSNPNRVLYMFSHTHPLLNHLISAQRTHNRNKSVQPNITWILCLREWRRTKVLNCVYIFLSYSWMFNKGMKIHFTFSHFPNFPQFFFLTSVVKLFWFFFRYTPDLICSFRRLVSSLFVSTSVHSARM